MPCWNLLVSVKEKLVPHPKTHTHTHTRARIVGLGRVSGGWWFWLTHHFTGRPVHWGLSLLEVRQVTGLVSSLAWILEQNLERVLRKFGVVNPSSYILVLTAAVSLWGYCILLLYKYSGTVFFLAVVWGNKKWHNYFKLNWRYTSNKINWRKWIHVALPKVIGTSLLS